MNNQLERELLAKELETDLLNLYGTPVIGGNDLQRVLGYRSRDAFRQAVLRKTVSVKTFKIENRRGQFALVKDFADWLALKRIPEDDIRGGEKT